jgi:putative effector of murein hydrolase
MSANSLPGGLEFLAATPLLWLSLTLGAYLAAVVVNERCNKTPLLNPTLLAIAIVVAVLAATGTSYKRYFDGAQFVHFLLGPAVVAMAVPLYRHTEIIRKSAGALLGALGIGSVTAILSSVLLARGLGGGRELWLSMAPKSATAAISMAISGRIGGVPALTAVLTISTGITGACLAGYVLRFVGVKEMARTRFRDGPGEPRHRHRSCLSGERGGRNLRRPRDGAERHRDGSACALDTPATRPRSRCEVTVGRPVNVGVEETLASAAPGCFMIFVVRPRKLGDRWPNQRPRHG